MLFLVTTAYRHLQRYQPTGAQGWEAGVSWGFRRVNRTGLPLTYSNQIHYCCLQCSNAGYQKYRMEWSSCCLSQPGLEPCWQFTISQRYAEVDSFSLESNLNYMTLIIMSEIEYNGWNGWCYVHILKMDRTVLMNVMKLIVIFFPRPLAK